MVRIVVVLPFREHVIDQPDCQQVEVGIILIILSHSLLQLAQVLVDVTAELDAVQARHSSTCLKGDFLAIDSRCYNTEHNYETDSS